MDAATTSHPDTPSTTRTVAVITGVVVVLAAAGYVVGASVRRLVDEGFELTAFLTIFVVIVCLGVAIADRWTSRDDAIGA